jgi:subtilisin family serine protease
MRAISADQAWAAGYLGSEDVTLAILDTGLDYTNPDLAGRVDLSRSISLLPQDDSAVDANFPGKHYITDLHYHGTHVATTAVSNGVVGAGVTSQTTLMGVKVCSVYGGCYRIFEAIEYAVANGADIINMSLGGNFSKSDYPGYVSIINRYINHMNSQGVLLVVSAGNSAFDLDHDRDGYKTYCNAPHAVCVAGTGPLSAASVNGPWVDVDAPYYATNYGRSAINVAAPAGNYGAAVWAACSQTSLAIPVCQTGNYILGLRGTSMAAPHVSGLAAMIMAVYGTGNPSATRAMLEKSADDLGQRGTDPFYGKGRINAANAMGLN